MSLSQEQADRLQCARIAEAMVETVADLGYVAATVKRVCERAGISTRTFYRCFASRRDGFFYARGRVLHDLCWRLGAAWEATAAKETGPLVVASAAAAAAWVDAEPRLAHVCFVQGPIASAVGGGPADRHLDELRDWIAARVGPPEGRSVHELAALLAGALQAALVAGDTNPERLTSALARVLGASATNAAVRRAVATSGSLPAPAAPSETLEVLEIGLRDLQSNRTAPRGVQRLRALALEASAAHDLPSLEALRKSLAEHADGRVPPGHEPALRGLTELADAALTAGPRGVLELAGRAGSRQHAVSPQARRCLTLITERPGLSNREIATLLEIRSEAQVSRLLSSLRRDGLIVDRGTTSRAWHPQA